MTTLIKELFNTKFGKFTIIECGCAATISNTILSEEGASNFIEECHQYYSKRSQEIELLKPVKRSVSKELVSDFLSHVGSNCLTASFQLAGEKTITHGWIGIILEKEKHFYHISILEKKSRKAYLEDISKIAISILYKHLVDKNYSLVDCNIDGVYKNEEINFETIQDILLDKSKENVFCFNKNQEFIKFEDLIRDNEGIILMRGSFNPPHYGHWELFKRSIEKFSDYSKAWQVSINRYGKTPLTSEDLKERIKLLSIYNLPIIFTTGELYSDFNTYLDRRYLGKKIIYPVGMDTINRFVEFEIEKERSSLHKIFLEKFFNHTRRLYLVENWRINKKFLVFNRKDSIKTEHFSLYSEIILEDNSYIDDGISSTKIRNKTE